MPKGHKSTGSYLGAAPAIAYGAASGKWSLPSAINRRFNNSWTMELPVKTNLLSWYDVADSASVTVTNGKVSSLLDKSGNSRHATQATAGQQPLYTTNAINGLPTMEFTQGNSTVLTIANAVAHSAGTVHIFGVVKAKGMATTNNAAFYGAVNQSNVLSYCFPGAVSANRQTLLHAAVAWFTSSSVASFGTTSFYQLNASWDGTNVAYRQSRTDDGTTTYTGRPVGTSNAIGCQENTSYSNIYVSELIVYSSPLSTVDRNAVENYLYTKWGV